MNETIVRLTYGCIHLEFILLADNFVKISESIHSINESNLPPLNSPFSMESFWRGKQQPILLDCPSPLYDGIILNSITLENAMSLSSSI